MTEECINCIDCGEPEEARRMTKAKIKKFLLLLLAMPFFINLMMAVIIGFWAFYTFLFMGESSWLFYSPTHLDEVHVFGSHVSLTFCLLAPAIPFFNQYLK